MACSTRDVSDAHYVNNFKTVVATAPQDRYTPYWLRDGFEAGGLRFKGPYTADFAQDVAGGGVAANYNAPNGLFLTLTSYSEAAWNRNGDRTPIGSSSRSVTVAGHDASLITTVEREAIAALRLDFQMGETHVVAVTYAVQPLTPRANANPLVDEASFLGIMQKLRPYPQ